MSIDKELEQRLEELKLFGTETTGYLTSQKVTTRHECWLMATALGVLALNSKMEKLLEVFDEGSKSKTKKKE